MNELESAPAGRRRALIILCASPSLPSSVVRGLQFRGCFESDPGWQAEFVHQKSDRIDNWLTSAWCSPSPWVRKFLPPPIIQLQTHWEARREEEILRLARGCDVVYLTKFPHLRLCRRLRELRGPRVIVDLNDGLWLPQFQKPETGDILAAADAVICENGHQAEFARKHNGCVHVVPDSPQLEMFERLRGQVARDPSRLVLGWVGGEENVHSLYRILEPLEALFEKHPHLSLRLVGCPPHRAPRFESVRHSCLARYDQNIMVREALAFDIGLFPMFHNRDGLARGTLKAKIYMCAGAVVACENYGENPALIRDGDNGILAGTQEEWFQKLDELITRPEQRLAIAARGLETMRTQFHVQTVFATLTATFDRVLEAAAR